jgi:tRNA A-37 threonylcarbamoyl transferase component Bud32
MAWFETLPRYASLFRRRGWDSASSFLSWTGILVNQHRNRQVEQVTLEPEAPARAAASLAGAAGSNVRFFLKKEYAVCWRDRFRNAWHGFGWCSTAVREAAILQALREAGIGCPEVVALGEDRRQAFVLLGDESAMTELRVFLPTLSSDEECHCLAGALGRELARMHDAGFDHPDLFAKHILVSPRGATFRFCILDWQRARRRRRVSWRLRCRDLAVLDATLHGALASARLRLRCLHAYVRALSVQEGRPLGRLARQIHRQAARLATNRHIREVGQLSVPASNQQFVSLQGGRLLVVRSYYEKLGGQLPGWLTRISGPDASARVYAESLQAAGSHAPAWEPGVATPERGNEVGAVSGAEEVSLQSWPASASSREIPPLGHTLFRLQRFGVPAPRLLAVGFSAERVYLVAESATTVPLAEAFAKASVPLRARMLRQAGWIVRQIHEAGYSLPAGDAWERRLGVIRATYELFVVKFEPLLRGALPWQELAPLEFNRQKIRLSRTEQLRFLQGYLKHRRGGDQERTARTTHLLPRIKVWERQAVS